MKHEGCKHEDTKYTKKSSGILMPFPTLRDFRAFVFEGSTR